MVSLFADLCASLLCILIEGKAETTLVHMHTISIDGLRLTSSLTYTPSPHLMKMI